MENYDNPISFDVMERGDILRDAVLDGDIAEVTAAIETGTCRPEEPDANGRTVLHLAACRGHTAILRLLINSGCDINAEDRQGNTPLHWCGHIDTLETLVEMGANVNARNKMGFTPKLLAQRRGVPKCTLELFEHFEKENASQASHTNTTTSYVNPPRPSVIPSVWYEFYCEMGTQNTCLLVLGLLGFSLYLAYILTGLHRGYEEKIPLDETSYKIHL
ncbi:ankyrin repeat domain-containing protein 46-like [Haliotis rubra]|uniref:ankyrin repeat domain-containing protein 46-like n=1 Tax=Haliotis rubra TaxID=36100 RepID=UPI001EE5FA1C|nr:ankyrin repeat domain-containing protein 46-like [Haliotis rubra]